MSTKETNPKGQMGIRKLPLSVIPTGPLSEVEDLYRKSGGCLPMKALIEPALGMFEGARKYGRHNYRVSGVMSSVYYDAFNRHIAYSWWSGEDMDKDSGLHHVSKAIATLLVLRDAMMTGSLNDDRPPKTVKPFIKIPRMDHPNEMASGFYYTICDYMRNWWEGGEPEMVGVALFWLFELKSAIELETLVDDRDVNPMSDQEWKEVNDKIAALIEKYPDPVTPYTENNKSELRN